MFITFADDRHRRAFRYGRVDVLLRAGNYCGIPILFAG
jgi:hypothetical protein